MTNVVADETLGRFARQQHDWFERVRKGSLDPEEVGRAVQGVIDRSYLFQRNKRKDDWELMEDAGFTPINPANLELIPFLKSAESCIVGHEMVRRAEELKANLGQHYAEYLLEHQAEIPEEFREYLIVFSGTIWRDSSGNLRVAYLDWHNGQWNLNFAWLEFNWYSSARLARSRE